MNLSHHVSHCHKAPIKIEQRRSREAHICEHCNQFCIPLSIEDKMEGEFDPKL